MIIKILQPKVQQIQFILGLEIWLFPVTGLLGIEPRLRASEAPVISSTPQTFIVKKFE